MKACQGFIYLVSLFVLVTGVWSALPLPKDKIVPLYSHTWEPKTAEMGLQKQYLKGNNTPFSSRVLVKEIEVEGKKRFAVMADNPFSHELHVNLKVDGREIGKPEKIRFSVPSSGTDGKLTRIAVLQHKPKTLVAEFGQTQPLVNLIKAEHADRQ
ncbi:hypothetical protein PtA15_4A763 [Puccinia triticina]|uniref:Uncharacterized protein n=1 Tax=Puccinia triticina TaxID=208348 RepID=A0ABY7CGU2_9BASI|nr:uncharacterized protein PtA15_4A763 [Puccinia triticina]WAQ84310.1 hypothetical protein PtA15_4A763 [Puccinia triticina]WAR55131.1 hypothetical protein PtB15_4B751 [Puccinia triticina]